MKTMTEPDRYRDVLPPPGWEPKSDFFKSIMARGRLAYRNKQVTLPCPHCGAEIPLHLGLDSPDKP